MEMRPKTYDSDCLELARSFLIDFGPWVRSEMEVVAIELAKEIQGTIEDFLAESGLES